jgi:hypothetical protein
MIAEYSSFGPTAVRTKSQVGLPEGNLKHFSQATEDKALPGRRVEFCVKDTQGVSSRMRLFAGVVAAGR